MAVFWVVPHNTAKQSIGHHLHNPRREPEISLSLFVCLLHWFCRCTSWNSSENIPFTNGGKLISTVVELLLVILMGYWKA